jgi:hypothetical protein
MTYALALPQHRSRASLYGTRAQLALGNGDVEGALALAGCDRRAGTASYALRVDNQSEHPLRARMTCLKSRGNAVLAYPLDVKIAPYSRCDTLLPVRLDEIGRYDRAIVEIAGGEVAFTLEAPAPDYRYRRFPWLQASAAAMTLGLFSAVAAAFATPHLALLAAPQRVFAGNAIDVPYEFGGIGSLEYAVRTPDGRQLTAGIDTAHTGTLHFAVPPSAGNNVVLSVRVGGLFGNETHLQRIAVAPPPPAPPRTDAPLAPRIAEFVLATPLVRAGDTLKVTYTTNAAAGDIWLLDEAGRLWAHAPIAADGMTEMTVPQGTAGREMRAVLHARNGSADAVASLGFTVLPGALTPEAQPAAASPDRPAENTPVMNFSPAQPAPGQDFLVSISGSHGDTKVTMTDDTGTTIEDGDIAPGQDAVTLSVPSITKTQTFYVTASISDGVSTQTIVKQFSVSPQ